jgi:hypothetical protein
MRKLLLAAALSSAAFTAHAQSAVEMGGALTMLETIAQRTLDKYGVEADVMSLSLAQLAEIKTNLDREAEMDESTLKDQLQKIVAND